MIFNSKSILALSIGLVFLTGCQVKPTSNIQVSSPLQVLSDAAQEAQIAQSNLKNTRAESMRDLQIRQSNINNDLINVDYIGEPIPLIKSIASHFGYRFLENGQPSALPIVNLKKTATGTESLKDISAFLNNANIVLDHQNKAILLSYK